MSVVLSTHCVCLYVPAEGAGAAGWTGAAGETGAPRRTGALSEVIFFKRMLATDQQEHKSWSNAVAAKKICVIGTESLGRSRVLATGHRIDI